MADEYAAHLVAQDEAGHSDEAASASDPETVSPGIAAVTPVASSSGLAPRKHMRCKTTVHAIGQSNPVCCGDGLGSGAPEDTSAFYSVRCMPCGESPDPRATLEKELATLAQQIREHPTVPADSEYTMLPNAKKNLIRSL